jgi:hypothetical protein
MSNFASNDNMTALFTAAGTKIGERAKIFPGTRAEWDALPLSEKIKYDYVAFDSYSQSDTVDNVPTENSGNLVKSGGVWSAINDIKPTYILKTLSANNTLVTFTNLPTTGNYIADFFISDGSPYESIDASVSGQVTVTYAAKSSNRVVTCKLERM